VKHHFYNAIDYNTQFIACPDCDLLMHKIRPPDDGKSACPRCGRVLLQHCRDSVTRSLALALAGMCLYFPAVLMPLLTFQQLGLHETGNILQTIMKFLDRDYYFVAAAVFFSVVIFPLLKLSLLATVALCLRIGKYPPFLGRLFRIYNHLGEWVMVEVYLLGIVITVIKMLQTVEIDFNIGFFCFTGLVLITMASSLAVCRESFWNLIENKGKSDSLQVQRDTASTFPFANHTAAGNSLAVCSDCDRLSPVLESMPEGQQRCSRCGAVLHLRKPASLGRTWALIITAALFLYPANFLPIMRVEFFGIPSHSTILDGIILFFQDGSYIIGLIILTASILVPVFKIVGLAIVLLTIKFNRPRYLRQKTAMFRFIAFIGRWSMLDIFVIALLGFFVNFGFFSSIETAPAATYFCLMVVATMLAALTFDPRIMWDLLSSEKPQDKSAITGETLHGTNS